MEVQDQLGPLITVWHEGPGKTQQQGNEMLPP